MKAKAQQVRATGNQKPHLSGPGIHGKACAGAGNRHRAHFSEIQAEQIAARVMRGEYDLARFISFHPVAGFRATGSYGQPMSPPLRRRMEEAFGADLSSVRIHSGTSAHAATSEYAAEAITSGRDIYFGRHKYSPQTRRGRHLLAHEIAHVLQQTGRSDSRGRLCATDLQGTGEPQCKADEFVELADKFEVFKGPSDWDSIKRAYEGTADLTTHVSIIEAYFPPTFPMSSEQVKDLASETTKASFKSLSNEIQGLYADALKMVGGYEAATRIVIANLNVPTAFRSRPFYEVARKSLSWIYLVVANSAFAKDYYPGRFVNSYRTFFLFPSFGAGDLDSSAGKAGAKTFRQKILAELTAQREAKKLRTNELVLTGLLALYYLDEGRRERLPKQIENLRSQGKSLLEAHRDLAKSYGRDIAEDSSPSRLAESKALFSAVIDDIKKDATAAATFWNRALEFHRAHRLKAAFKDLSETEVKAIATEIRIDTRFKRFPTVVLETAKQMFDRPKGNLLNRETFATRIEKQRAALGSEMSSYGSRISELIIQGKDAEPEGLRLGLAIAYLSDVEQVLAEYNSGRDLDLSKKKLADERIATRVRLAHKLLEIAVLFDWDSLRSAANNVFYEGLQIALLSKWESDESSDFGRLSKQMGPEVADFEGTKISGAVLDRYLYIQYFEIISTEISRLLLERQTDFSAQTPILTEALKKATAEVRRPRRYIVREWEVGDPTMAEEKVVTATVSSDFGQTVFAHPLTTDLLKRERKKDEWWLAPTTLISSSEPLFLWVLPRFDEFIKLISGLPVVKDAVDAHRKLRHPGSTVPDPQIDPFAWVDALKELAIELRLPVGTAHEQKKKQELLEAIGRAIEGAVEGKFEKTRSEAHSKAREAVSHERRLLVEKHLQPLLASYDRYELGHWYVPGEVFNLIRQFAQFVWPKTDQVLQVSAMILEIASELMTAFGPKESALGTSHIQRFDIIDTVLTLATEAVRVWEAGQAEMEEVAKGTASLLNPITKISWLTQSELDTHAETLKKLAASLGKRAEAEQKRHGLRGKKDSKSLSSIYWDEEGFALIKWNMSHTSVKQGQSFTLYGTDYLIIDVYETFAFHPGFGARETLSVNWPAGPPRPGDAKLLDEAGNAWRPSGTKLLTILRKPRYGDSETFDITDQDTSRLEWLSGILSEHFAFEYIAAAGVFIEKYAALIMDVLEFLPGVGQGLATARFVASILETISNPEFLDLLDAFSKDGFGAFDKIFEAFSSVVDIEELANVLIFGVIFDADFEEKTRSNPKLRGKDDRQKKISNKGGPWARIARLLKNVIEIGVRVLDRLKRLSKRVQTPVRAAQLWVLRTPAAILILDLIERGFEFLSSLSIDDLAQAAEDLVEKGWQEMIKESATKAAQGVVDRSRDTFDTLRHLELPEEVIPVEWIVDFIIDLAVRALSAKYRKGVQAIRGILRTLGLWDKILKVIKDRLYSAGVDPNELYRKHVRDKLQPWFANVRDEFAGEVTTLLQSVPFLSAIIQPKGTPIHLDFSGLGFPEAEGYLAKANGRGTGPVLPTQGSGLRLPRAERFRAEAALGHDFSHVRLHRGSEGDRVTRPFGAEAITTGSHVFLRSGLDPDDHSGRRVLHHELTHVVQQTGARPLGQKFPDSPSIGRPGVGLRFDKRREAAADQAAERADRGNVASEPIAPTGKASGLQPAFTRKFLRTFLGRLHSEADIRESQQEIEKAKKSVILDPQSKAVADALSAALKPWISKKNTYEPPFSTVHAQLKTFADAVWPEFESSVPLLVSRAVTTKSPSKESGVEEGAVAYLPAENLKVQLERELYGLTSIAFILELNEVKGPKTIKGTLVVDKNKPIKSASAVYVHLPLLPENENSEKLWDLLVENTFKGTTDYNKTSHASFKVATKLVLQRGSASPDIYQKTDFKLTAHRAKVIRNQRERLIEYVDVTKTPSWPTGADYVNTSTSGLVTGLANIGLRLGTYGTWGPSTKSVTDRDAHHIVQFLLFEYFRNVKTKQPFPLLGKSHYPGVQPTSPGSSEVRSIGKIDVDNYFPGHGGAMPTIFIARTTHQANIHYRSEPPDDGSIKRQTQGASIDNTFRGFLGDYERVMKDATVLSQLEQNRKAKKDEEPVGSSPPVISVNRVGKRVFDAAQNTYKDMWKEMKPKLKRALEVQEVDYYNSIAKLRGEKTINKTIMATPFSTVAKEAEKEIGTTAGFGPGYAP